MRCRGVVVKDRPTRPRPSPSLLMSSASELRRRIDSLARTIACQKHYLEQLERQRRAAERELNSIIDPMARLPVEISSDIIIQSLPKPANWRALSNLLSVCHTWRDFVLAMPPLWTSISDEGVPPAQFGEMLEFWVAHTRGMPLSAFIHNTSLAGSPLQRQMHRIQHLELLSPIDDGDLKILSTYPLGALRTLTLGRGSSTLWIPRDALLEVLRSAANLVELNLRGVRFPLSSFGSTYLTHPTLRHLHLGQLESRICSGTEILRDLILPRLETICVSCEYNAADRRIAEEDLLGFLKRCDPPPLRSLQVHPDRRDSDSTSRGSLTPTMLACLELVPNLTQLEIIPPNSGAFLNLLAKTPTLLPTLRRLSLYEHSACGRVQDGYSDVSEVMERRHGCLESLQVAVERDDGTFVGGNPSRGGFKQICG
ncbi:hypothetical protein FB45DRAFT_392273 [Roridomyces roridus]|uniref:F-box domain-containing protein n=1 Tax=Roridomyces roridus TaxID=1738132 RepID=A0AAD7B2L2_9AGAR|nr:hypothetical protein FB45DRAFT_392273 [Roridomyces roridus]